MSGLGESSRPAQLVYLDGSDIVPLDFYIHDIVDIRRLAQAIRSKRFGSVHIDQFRLKVWQYPAPGHIGVFTYIIPFRVLNIGTGDVYVTNFPELTNSEWFLEESTPHFWGVI